jgi:NTP pyrophosphatase (non-canonical NTP hydrolase)
LSAALKAVVAFRDARDWKQFHAPKELATALNIEAGELQELFLWRERETAAQIRRDPPRITAMEAEIADVAIYLLLLCEEMKIDLSGAIAKKIRENGRRYPVSKHRGVARKAARKPVVSSSSKRSR